MDFRIFSHIVILLVILRNRVDAKGCDDALGMKNRTIPDSKITASSQWDPNHAAHQARLHFPGAPGKSASWSSRTNDIHQWLQIDLGSQNTKLTAIASQGRADQDQWVTKFKLQYSDNGVHFYYYKEPGQGAPKEFAANTDRNTVVYHELSLAVRAKYIRIRPTAWHSHISMRIELFGCKECHDALGMESHVIPDSKITASSHWDPNHAAHQARLHFPGAPGKSASWSSRTNDINQWLQIDLGSQNTKLTAIASQGRADYDQWVTKFKLQYSDNGVHFYYYKEPGQRAPKEFAANTDRNTVVYHELSQAVRAKYIRIGPTAWHSHISMRIELFGCKDVNECENSPCKNGGSCVNKPGSYECKCDRGYQGRHCESDINECQNSPCLNGAACINKPGSYECKCGKGYHGKLCQNDTDECLKSPCHNGATCVNKPGSYECECISGYHGKHCGIDIDECQNSSCQNGATCVNKLGSFECRCVRGYQGKHCNIDVNECLNNPCLNGATCINKPGSYECKCASGYHGNICHIDTDECQNSPCQNGATCLNKPGRYECKCIVGYNGKNCDTDIDECLKNPCHNNGNCSNTVGNYTCKCVQGFEGKNCERDIDECKESSPCQNGTCENKNGTYKCKCQKGFLGLNCEIEELGCFKDKAKDRTMGDHMLESLRKYIDWGDMSKTVRNCSEIAKRKKKYYFAIQYYGECWGASADTQYNKHGPSDNCWSGVGGSYTNFVYRNTDV